MAATPSGFKRSTGHRLTQFAAHKAATKAGRYAPIAN